MFLVLSPMPWTKQDAIEQLSVGSSEPPYGYIDSQIKLISNRESPALKNFLQILVCFGGGMFDMHVCMARLNTESVSDGYEFILYPTELLNSEEQALVGL